MENKNLNEEESNKVVISRDEEKDAATWAAGRLNDVYDDDSENNVILSQYDIHNKKDFIS